MKQMIKLALVLAAFASVACVLLALVNNATLPAIQAVKNQELTAGLKEIFADATDFVSPENFTPETKEGVSIEQLYIAKSGDKTLGVVVQATGPTYDKATILTGILPNRTISSIKILSISDTSGFGQNALKPEFYTQFAGKSIEDKFSAHEDIDGLSGATITRQGIGNILKVSTQEAAKYLNTENQEEISKWKNI